MQTGLLSLNFNCTCWQNRKARIYLSSPEFEAAADQSFRRNLELGTTRIVLSQVNPLGEPRVVILPDGTQCTSLADPGNNSFHCEFQVWKRSKKGYLSLFLDPEPSGLFPDTAQTKPSPTASSTSPSLYPEIGLSHDSEFQQANPSAVGSLHDPHPSNPSNPSQLPIVVERALRSRVAYSERPSKLTTQQLLKEDTIRMAHVALCNDRVYCTIDCMKGLKVQMLSIVCIFRIGERYFASNFTPFPPPSSLKRKERSRIARPKRAAPFRKRFSLDDDDDDDEDDEDSVDNNSVSAASSTTIPTTSTPNTPHSLMLPKKSAAPPMFHHDQYSEVSPGHVKNNNRSLPTSRILSRFHPTTLPLTPETPKPPMSLGSLAQTEAPFRQSSWAMMFHRLRAVATPYVEHTLACISRVAFLQTLFTGIPNHTSHDDLARWCLFGSTPLESKLVAGLLDIFSVPCFVGQLDNSFAFELLSYSLPSASLGSFVIRISKEEFPSLEVYGVFRSPQSDPSTPSPLTEYCATVRYHVSPDPHRPALFWIDTEMNHEESRCTSISGLVSYVSRITAWAPFDRDSTHETQWSPMSAITHTPNTQLGPQSQTPLGRNSWHSSAPTPPSDTHLVPMLSSPLSFNSFYANEALHHQQSAENSSLVPVPVAAINAPLIDFQAAKSTSLRNAPGNDGLRH